MLWAFLPVGERPAWVATADFDSDSKLDLIVATTGYFGPGVWLVRGDGSGGFGSPVLVDNSMDYDWVLSADLDGDGRADLLTGTYSTPYPNSVLIRSWLGDGAGHFTPTAFSYSIYIAFLSPPWPTVADFNGDGSMDLVVAGGDVRLSWETAPGASARRPTYLAGNTT